MAPDPTPPHSAMHKICTACVPATAAVLQGRGGQVGAEGFIMGSSYLFFSSTLASLTYVVPKIRGNAARGVVSLVLVLLAAFTAMRIIAVYQKKSGLNMRTFFSFYH